MISKFRAKLEIVAYSKWQSISVPTFCFFFLLHCGPRHYHFGMERCFVVVATAAIATATRCGAIAVASHIAIVIYW